MSSSGRSLNVAKERTAVGVGAMFAGERRCGGDVWSLGCSSKRAVVDEVKSLLLPIALALFRSISNGIPLVRET